MKKSILILPVFLFILSFNFSCDKIEKLTEVEFNTTLTETVSLNLQPEITSISEEIQFDLSESAEAQDYLDLLESVEITELSYKITQYNGDVEAQGSVEFASASQTFGPYNHTFADDVNQANPITGTSKINALANHILSQKKLNILISGDHNATQVSDLDIEFSLKLKIIAQPL